MAHEHNIVDSDKTFRINPATRAIENPSGKITLIQYDHNSERFGFSLPRFVEGHDMADSTSIQIHYINIGSNSENNSGVYGVTDAAVDPDDPEMMKFSWLVSSNCTQLVGSLSFAIRFSCVNNGITEYSWGTSAFSGMNVSTSIQNTETVVMEHADIIAAWEARISALENGSGDSVISWNDLEDKPFSFNAYSIGFDPAQAGVSESNYIDMGMCYVGPYNVDEWTTSAENLVDATIVGFNSAHIFGINGIYIENENGATCEQVVTYDDCVSVGTDSSYVMFDGANKACIVFVSETDAGTTALDLPSMADGSTMPITFPSAGMWVMKYATTVQITSIEWREYKTLDHRFIPETIIPKWLKITNDYDVLSANMTYDEASELLRNGLLMGGCYCIYENSTTYPFVEIKKGSRAISCFYTNNSGGRPYLYFSEDGDISYRSGVE